MVFHNQKTMKNEQEHIDETLMLKIIENRADEMEKALFANWLENSELHATVFEQFKKAYQLNPIDSQSLARNWEAVVSKVKTGERVPAYIELPGMAQPFVVKRRLNTLMRVAALFLLLLGIGFLIKVVVFDSEQLTIYGNNRDSKVPYTLDDGSLVYLNKQAEITFSKKFGKRDRKLSLKGEAFFEVKRNEKNPFVISTYKTTTKVLGTKFNVYSDRSEQVMVSVESGLVEFRSDKSKEKVLLADGEKGTYHPLGASITKESINDPNFLSWKSGILRFANTPLPEAFRLLQHQYAKVFVFEGNQTNIPTLTTTLDNVPLEAVLEELNLLLNTKNVTRNDTIFIHPNN